MKPPTFFLSSTIYDFKDLRSAIKYYLEQQGCRVLASDQNDFPKPLDVHSYEACLKSIAQADYFILLIGARVGGWYDKKERVSITQREYREAYRLHQEGKLKILSFVRADVWQMREERKALGRHLRDFKLESEVKSQIVNLPSKFADDPDFTIKFIEEVGKNRETGAAAKGSGPFPTGNWLHVFDGFKEVIEQLQVQAFNGLKVDEAGLRRLLRQDLMELLRVALLKLDKGVAIDPAVSIKRLYGGIHGSLDLTKDLIPTVPVERDVLFHLFQFSTNLAGKLFVPRILPEALKSSTFLTFDAAMGKLTEQPVYRALLALMRELELFGMVDKLAMSKGFMEYMGSLTDTSLKSSDTILASKMHLLTVMHLLDRWVNVGKLCKAIVRHLDGAPFVMPTLQGKSPIYDEDDASRFEATEHDAEWYLGLPNE